MPRAHGPCKAKAARDSVRRVWFAASQSFSGPGHPVREAQAALEGLRDRVRNIKVGLANSAAVLIPQVHHVPVAIRHARAWEEA